MCEGTGATSACPLELSTTRLRTLCQTGLPRDDEQAQGQEAASALHRKPSSGTWNKVYGLGLVPVF